jgi:hypothetical protein
MAPAETRTRSTCSMAGYLVCDALRTPSIFLL